MSGVHVGIIKAYDPELRHAVIEDARCIWYWTNAFTLYAVSQKGIGSDSKVTMKVPELLVTDVVEIIKLTPEAKENIENIPAYVHLSDDK